MMSSMTAFARIQELSYTWEIRSVNHRGLEIRLKIPDQFRELETRVREETRKMLRRGYVEIFFFEHTQDRSQTSDGYTLDTAVPQAIETVVSSLPSKSTVNVVDVTRLLQNPNLLRNRSNKDDYDLDELMTTFQICLTQLIDTRQQEGQALRKLVEESIGTVRDLLRKIEALGKEQPKWIREQLLDRLRGLEKHVDPNRVAQEVALLAQKSDFKEEQDRLTIHLQDIERCLAAESPIGRRLNFLTQEILREANTLAAKAQVPTCATLVIDLKVCVDQMREQVQNIE